MVTISFNNMSNNYMNMNLLLSEKALLLGDIDLQHGKNKWLDFLLIIINNKLNNSIIFNIFNIFYLNLNSIS